MPGPMTLVTLFDAEGDGFPIAMNIEQPDTDEGNEAATESAALELAVYARMDKMRPVDPIEWKATTIERFNYRS